MTNVMEEATKYIEKYITYWEEKNRRKTFKTWVFSDKEVCNANKLAEAGFIFIGTRDEPDGVVCFFCAKSLDGWDETDDPWLEHMKHAPNCTFAKLQKPQDSMLLKDYLDLREEYKKVLLQNFYNKVKDSINEKFVKYESAAKKYK